jgi:hypothetical protein
MIRWKTASAALRTAAVLLAGMTLASWPAAGNGGPNDGINALKSVSTLQADQASEEEGKKAGTTTPTAPTTKPPPKPTSTPIQRQKPAAKKAQGDAGTESQVAPQR